MKTDSSVIARSEATKQSFSKKRVTWRFLPHGLPISIRLLRRFAPRNDRVVRLALFLLAIGFAVLPLYSCKATPSNPLQPQTRWRQVRRVVDGDTLVLVPDERVRLIGIDTPEVHPSDKLTWDAKRSQKDVKEIQALGREATEITQKLMAGGKVRLEYGPTQRDVHGRTLAYVYFLMKEDQLLALMDQTFREGRAPLVKEYMLNRVLVKYGYAKAYTRFPFPYSGEFRELEKKAQENNWGLWGKP